MPITGVPFTLDTVDVVGGWNMVGTVSDTVVVLTGIEEVPPGIVETPFYEYAGGYNAVAQLTPSRGYWVKTNAAGQLVLAATPGAAPVSVPVKHPAGLGELTITDAAGNSQTLYLGFGDGAAAAGTGGEMPPLPPDGVFDARFASGRMTEYVGCRGRRGRWTCP